jgi:UDP-2,3-diacylglucosamine hydrolase
VPLFLFDRTISLGAIFVLMQSMRPTLFISDLHLTDEHAVRSKIFFRFTREIAVRAESLYILGDLFEYWVGDDQLDHDPLARAVADALRVLAATGVQVYFMRGNRDFLIGERFAQEAALDILDDPHLIELNGERILLMHGDTLCTDDTAYQQFRALTRSEKWQRETLAKPYAERNALARAIRAQSDSAKAKKSDEIMDVSQVAVDETFRRFDYPILLHGHTHRPASHVRHIDARETRRWVLPDWTANGFYLNLNSSKALGYNVIAINRSP